MGEIKIVVSDKTDKILHEVVEDLGIKKTEFVKSLVIESLKEIKLKKKDDKK